MTVLTIDKDIAVNKDKKKENIQTILAVTF